MVTTQMRWPTLKEGVIRASLSRLDSSSLAVWNNENDINKQKWVFVIQTEDNKPPYTAGGVFTGKIVNFFVRGVIPLDEVEVVAEATTPITEPVVVKPKTLAELENGRRKDASSRIASQQNTKIQQIDPTVIEDNTPEDAKLKGKAKLGARILQIGKTALKLILPKVLSLAEKYAAEQFEKARQETPPDQIAELKAQYCPTPDELQKLIDIRNNIVGQLNNLGNKLKPITISVGGLQDITAGLTGLASLIETTKVSISTAATILPPGTVPGAVPAILSNLEIVDDKVIPLLEKNSWSLNNTFIPTAVVSSIITKIIVSLSPLDSLILLCKPDVSLDPISGDIQSIVLRETQAESIDEGSYKGFIFQIEEVPYSPTVTRRRAIALNQSNIPLLKTELSFTTNNQTLINELKLIIDRDNLKPY